MASDQDKQPVVEFDEYPLFSDADEAAPKTETDPEPQPAVGPVVVLDFDDEDEPAQEEEDDSDEQPEQQAVVVRDDPAPEQAVVVMDEAPARPAPSTSAPLKLEKTYSSEEVAKKFFGKSTQWLYWGMRDKDAEGNAITPVFVYEDGTPIEPKKIGKGQRRRYTLPIIKEMAAACYRRGNLKEPELRKVFAKIEAAEKDELIPVR
ncbi:hypothetical protein SEA_PHRAPPUCCINO_105 [Mycobacterium phage Phrappuccino]|uniref:DUF7229 domain-containing protein n=1 Tax=Mycobacterium phage Phrappuccino TaxID=2591223 RepID=A0A514DDU7_9CAUD|nr:hypothetical protein KHQ87_gp105 [Mycobacterium phage Phrappuccino]QDH91780.1 hypothetical protein SEA_PHRAPPUCCINO_105 [Mycobacterium phage Phrappuccino]QIQ63222.1 hypothetical protein SEA_SETTECANDELA_105 [Mycobacterium phage Settecandela]